MQDTGEQADILIEGARKRVERKWGNNAELLRVGELRIRPHHVFELGVSSFRGADIAMLDAITAGLPDMPQESIGIQWE